MPKIDLKEVKQLMPKGQRLLGIDHGSKTLGLAISNPELSIATPLKTIHKTKFTQDLLELKKICAEWKIGGFIIGLPLNMDGTSGARVESVQHFADNILREKEKLGFEPIIAFYDERLSTSHMQDFLIEKADLSRKRRKDVIDKMAAQTILQGALDKISRY